MSITPVDQPTVGCPGCGRCMVCGRPIQTYPQVTWTQPTITYTITEGTCVDSSPSAPSSC